MNRFLAAAVFIIFLVASFEIGFERGKNARFLDEEVPLENALIINKEKSKDSTLDFSLFWKAWDYLEEKYIDSEELDAKKMLYGAINGMFSATEDPYTIFLSPEENKKFDEEITGRFEGLGVELGVKNKILTVIAPLEGTPAEKAGLRPGDKVIEVDDKNTSEMTIDEAISKMRGPRGTEVKLTIFREGSEDTQEIVIKREIINVKSVKLEFKNDDVAYVKISRFGEDTFREFNGVTREILRKENLKGIILDLRNNPGGYLDASIDVASRMLPKGEVAVIEENSKKERKEAKTKGGDVLSQIKTIILINEGSASASEILAGALKDNRENVKIVGEKSFGKGSVQEFVDIPGSSSAVKITVARWLTPKGEQINEKGISPDIEVELTNDDYNNSRDPQLEKALEIIGQ